MAPSLRYRTFISSGIPPPFPHIPSILLREPDSMLFDRL
jgi:hypothetical protein